MTRNMLDILVEVIVEGQLFSRVNVARAHIEDVIFHNPRVAIGIAAMVYVLRPTPADVPVDAPVRVQSEEIVERSFGTPLRFATADLLAGVLHDLSAGWDLLFRKHSPSMNLGRRHTKFEGTKTRIQFWVRVFGYRVFGYRFSKSGIFGHQAGDQEPAFCLITSINSFTAAALLSSCACSSAVSLS